MTIKLLGKIPKKCYVALSGGPDSMALLDFLLRSRRDITALHFDHGTKHGTEARDFVESYCKEHDIPLVVGEISRERRSKESLEEYWRTERYEFFSQFSDAPILTAHHLSDATEWWVYTALHGEPKLIPYKRRNVIRPFLLTPKKVLQKWCQNHDVAFCYDSGNEDMKHMRSIVRHHLIPSAKLINPGVETVVKKMLMKKYNARGK